MGLFDKIFGESSSESKLKINWIPLTDISQLDEIKNQSKTSAIFIFKHSTRCGISRMVIKQFEKLFEEKHQNIKVYYLDLLNYRSLSNAIEDQFKVEHQSPQLIVIKNENSVKATSHYDITQIDLEKYI